MTDERSPLCDISGVKIIKVVHYSYRTQFPQSQDTATLALKTRLTILFIHESVLEVNTIN